MDKETLKREREMEQQVHAHTIALNIIHVAIGGGAEEIGQGRTETEDGADEGDDAMTAAPVELYIIA